MIVLIGQIGGQRVAVNRVGGHLCQRRLFRLALDQLDLREALFEVLSGGKAEDDVGSGVCIVAYKYASLS